MKTTLFTHVTVAFSCCLATFTACAGPETEIDPIGNAPVTISASISGEVVTKADNNYQPAEGNKKIFLYYKDGSNVKAHERESIPIAEVGRLNCQETASFGMISKM